MSDYEKSKSLETIPGLTKLPKSLKDRCISSENQSALYRHQIANKISEAVCKTLGIKTVYVEVRDRPQNHTIKNGRLSSKTLGRYWHSGDAGLDIEIFNKTAVRHQIVSSKTFFGTLLHELCHHIDCAKLGITSSPHTSGFYKRINYLDSCFK